MLQTKYTARNQRPSYAFLMEMIWVCGFFALAACIFVLAFVKADRTSRQAQDLNQAVTASQHEMEQAFLRGEEGSLSVFFDEDWQRIAETGSSSQIPSGAYSILKVESRLQDSLLCVTVTATVLEPSEEIVYTLEGSHRKGGQP